jgi:hypothetical protein
MPLERRNGCLVVAARLAEALTREQRLEHGGLARGEALGTDAFTRARDEIRDVSGLRPHRGLACCDGLDHGRDVVRSAHDAVGR